MLIAQDSLSSLRKEMVRWECPLLGRSLWVRNADKYISPSFLFFFLSPPT